MNRLAIALVLGALWIGAHPALAADAAVVLDSYAFTARGYSGAVLGTGGPIASFGPIVLVAEMDADAASRYGDLVTSTPHCSGPGTCTIDVRDAGATVLTIELRAVIITGHTLVANTEGDGNPREKIELTYGRIEWSVPGGSSSCWNVTLNTSC